MEFIKKFLKPKWQHANPDVRRQALSELNSVEQLLTFIAAETVADLRRAAVVRIRDEATLENLLGHNQDDVRQTAREHWLSLLMPAGQRLDGINSQTLVRIAGLTQDQDLRLQAIALISDEQERFNIASSHPVARVRLAAAEGIQKAELLVQLQDIAQGKDKAVYRLCKDRLAEYKAEEEARAAQAERIEQLFQQVRQLNRLGYGPDFNGRLQVISKASQELNAAMSAERQAEMASELAKAATVLREHEEEERRLAESRARAEAAAEAQFRLLLGMEALLAQSNASTAAEELHQQVQELDQQWRATLADNKPSADKARAFENGLQSAFALHSSLQQLAAHGDAIQALLAQPQGEDLPSLQKTVKDASRFLQQIRWPDAQPRPEFLRELAERQLQAEAAIRALDQQQTNRIDGLQRQIDQLEQHIQDGHLKEASKLYGQITTNLRQVDSRATRNLQRQARSLGARLSEMRDWQGFVTTPKKEALCEAMEALVGADIAPDILADKIQAMQDEWKTLNSTQPDRELWERFQAAGDRAFEPCREYFASVARDRELNVERRNQLIDELDRYETGLDWANADWKVVQKTLEAARETFRTYSPVERAAHNNTQERFRAVCDRIYAHVQNEYDRNLARKAALTEEAAAQIEAEDLTAAIDVIKQLQQDWKAVGVTPRAADQKLWKQFRTHCDAVFARLDQARAERKARLDDTVLHAEQLVAEALGLSQLELSVADKLSRLEELEQEFATLDLPRAAFQRVRKGFTDAANALDDQQQEQQKLAEQARWQGVIDRLQALADNSASDWDNAAALPREYRDLDFEQAWAQREELNSESAAARDLCIRMEVLAGIETSGADQARRMELQVQRLAQGLGQSQSVDQERQDLLQQWLTTSASADQQERFLRGFRASL